MWETTQEETQVSYDVTDLNLSHTHRQSHKRFNGHFK